MLERKKKKHSQHIKINNITGKSYLNLNKTKKKHQGNDANILKYWGMKCDEHREKTESKEWNNTPCNSLTANPLNK